MITIFQCLATLGLAVFFKVGSFEKESGIAPPRGPFSPTTVLMPRPALYLARPSARPQTGDGAEPSIPRIKSIQYLFYITDIIDPCHLMYFESITS